MTGLDNFYKAVSVLNNLTDSIRTIMSIFECEKGYGAKQSIDTLYKVYEGLENPNRFQERYGYSFEEWLHKEW